MFDNAQHTCSICEGGNTFNLKAERYETKVAKTVSEGDKAPKFKVPATSGGDVSLKDFAGKRLVIFFYPKDATSGCTKEAIGFTELQTKFSRRKVAILGVSRDTLASHEKFIDKHGLKMPLASDVDGKMCEAFGVWKEKSMYGRKFMGIERSTFLIDEDGIITRVWRKVRVAGHPEEVLEATAR